MGVQQYAGRKQDEAARAREYQRDPRMLESGCTARGAHGFMGRLRVGACRGSERDRCC